MSANQYLHINSALAQRGKKLKALSLAISLALIAASVPAQTAAEGASAAAQPLIDIAVDEARVMRLNRAPASVVVGNPLIADAVVEQNGVMFLIGKNYGTTNLIALDVSGKEIANYDVVVRTSGRNAVSVFRGSERVSLNCSPRCETELDVGDGAEHFEIIRNQLENKTSLSQAQADGSGR